MSTKRTTVIIRPVGLLEAAMNGTLRAVETRCEDCRNDCPSDAEDTAQDEFSGPFEAEKTAFRDSEEVYEWG